MSELPQPVPESAPLRVLIVEDTAPVAALIDAALRGEGMATLVARSGAEALSGKERFQPDIALIDLGLPDLDGMDLVDRFARERDCGVIVVTANAEEGVRIAGLDHGADDYIVKPPPLRELAARIRAVHRRITRPDPNAKALPGSQVTIDAASRSLNGPNGQNTLLTEAEFATLRTLISAAGSSVSRDWIGRVALRRPLGMDDRSVDQLVLKLRRKLAMHGITDRTILSSRGLGYVIPDPGRFVFGAPATRYGEGTIGN